MREARVALPDGRDLAYTEQGDPQGTPLLFIHGNPGSRYSVHPDETIAEKLGVRVITPDRPGYGRSSFQPGRVLLDFPDDISALADALGIEKFRIFGVSAGGPYVAACAYALPDRIVEAAIVSGLAPLNRPGALDGMLPAWQAAYQLSQKLPERALRGLLWLQSQATRRNPQGALDSMARILSEEDRALLADLRFRANILERQQEAVRQGVRGWAREAKILVSPWGFDLDEIQPPVHLWYWEADPSIPIQMGAYLASELPHARPHFLPSGGHLAIFSHWQAILTALIS